MFNVSVHIGSFNTMWFGAVRDQEPDLVRSQIMWLSGVFSHDLKDRLDRSNSTLTSIGPKGDPFCSHSNLSCPKELQVPHESKLQQKPTIESVQGWNQINQSSRCLKATAWSWSCGFGRVKQEVC